MQKLIPGGFPENTPQEQRLENTMLETVRKSYELNWFVNIETPAVELNSVLLAKGEGVASDQQIYGLFGLAQGNEDTKDYSLKFDQTVPLARYVIDHQNDIRFPFKRYQTQKVWRGEKPWKLRYREFRQCDVDIVGSSLPISCDSEVIRVLYETIVRLFGQIGVTYKPKVHLNNRKFAQELAQKAGVAEQDMKEFLGILDDYYKVDEATIKTQLSTLAGTNGGEWLMKTLKSDIIDLNSTEFGEGFQELLSVYQSLHDAGVNVSIDPFITRGLDYYTGTVFETSVEGYHDEFISFCSGGRYDKLISTIQEKHNASGFRGMWDIGGVWGSIGFTRLFEFLLTNDLAKADIPMTDVIVFYNERVSQKYRDQIASVLRGADIRTDVYPAKAKFSKQFSYADSKNIPLGIITDAQHEDSQQVELKNLDNRDSETIAIDDLVTKVKQILS